MSLHVRELSIAPEPFELARTLADRPGSMLAWLGDQRTAYLACDPSASSSAWDPEPELLHDPSARIEASVPRWFGVLPYEACRDVERRLLHDRRPAPHIERPFWFRYSAVAEITNRVRVIGDDPERVRELSERLLRPPHRQPLEISLAAAIEAGRAHEERIERALELIAKGEIYQVNLARRFEFFVQGNACDLLEALTRRGLLPYSAALRLPELEIAVASPELLLEFYADGRLCTAPIKGTRPRGQTQAEDAALARELDADPKERAELVMVLDVERNDLGKIALPGSVQMSTAPHVETHATVHHRLATLSAQVRPGTTRQAVLTAMLPSGSVTGAPKIRAMEVIAELEPHRRGFYTGGFGAVRHDGSLVLGMAIRALTIRETRGHYYTGGGIVADSIPAREVEETLWKARQVLELMPKRA